MFCSVDSFSTEQDMKRAEQISRLTGEQNNFFTITTYSADIRQLSFASALVLNKLDITGFSY